MQVEQGIYDTPCQPTVGTCVCQLSKYPTLRMRGLCKDSNIDSEYKLKYINNSIVFMGVSGTEVWLILDDTYNVFQLQRILNYR